MELCKHFLLLELATGNLELDPWTLELGTWHLELGTFNLEFLNFEIGSFNLEFDLQTVKDFITESKKESVPSDLKFQNFIR